MLTKQEKEEIAGRVAGILVTKFKKELVDEIKEMLPDVIDTTRRRIKDEIEPRVNNIMKNFDSFLTETNIKKTMEREAKMLIYSALRNKAEEWARKCILGVRFSFDDVYGEGRDDD